MFAQLKEAKEGGALNKAGSQSAYWLLPKTTSTTASQVHPAPTKIQIISCASPIDTISTSSKLLALYFSSDFFQASITIWLFPRQCKEESSPLSAPSFSSLRKTLLRNILTERWACYWLSCFKSGLQLKDSEIKVSFGFSAPLGDNFWNKHKGCAQQPRQKLVSKKYN